MGRFVAHYRHGYDHRWGMGSELIGRPLCRTRWVGGQSGVTMISELPKEV
ncbi:MAG: hypothetical protein V3R27_07790 [Pseudomonadales bacterium]